jgi:hypothetical protein
LPSSVIGATGDVTLALNGAASTPPLDVTGTWFTGGTSTTTKPQVLIEPAGTTSTAWSTSGTGLGVNAASGFAGNLLDLQLNGSRILNVTPSGTLRNGAIATSAVYGYSDLSAAINDTTANRNLAFNGTDLRLRSTIPIGWANGDPAAVAADITLSRGAAGRLDVIGTGNPTLTLRGSDAAYSGQFNIQAAGGGSSLINATGGNNALALLTGGAERARIDSSGRLGVGIAPAVYGENSRLTLNSTGLTNAIYSNFNGTGNDKHILLTNGGAANCYIGTDNTSLTFGQGSSERMRITSAGTHVFGGGTAESNGTITLYPNNSNGAGLLAWSRAGTTNTSTALVFRDGGVAVGTITYTNTATAYNTSSDYRLKENVVPLTGAIDRVNDLQVHRFNFIADPDKTVDGFIAHEAQAVVPECVTGEKDAVDDDGNPVYQGIDQSKLVPLLTAALQEAIGEIESLKARVAALEGA